MRKQLHIIFRLVMFSCILLFVSQEASAQITFSVKNQTIRQTIRVIEKKADYSFFYTDKLPGLDQKISLTVSNESIDAVLEKVFKGSSISYKINTWREDKFERSVANGTETVFVTLRFCVVRKQLKATLKPNAAGVQLPPHYYRNG